MPGQVIEGHAKWEEDCTKCHKRFDKAAQTQLCQDCHRDIRKDVESKQGLHGRLKDSRECRECHTEHKGRGENIAPVNKQTFDHAGTDFALKGAHADPKKTDCQSCHKPKVKYRDAPSDCLACHKKDDKHKGSLGPACADCHTERHWKETRFDHSKTRFLLRGKHADTKCEDCHANDRFKNTPIDCVSCHKKDDYHKGVFGQKCDTCHGEKDWKISPFNHDKDTKYPLNGKHAKVKCESCHKKPVVAEKTPTACAACHQKDDKHKGSFGEKCASCHVEKDWKAITFDHDRDTKYRLNGKHRATKCESCHKGVLYNDKTPTACYSCHKKDDKHKGGYGEKCERCHKGHLYRDKLKTACVACHEKDDTHKGQEGQKCEDCHNERSWKETRFDHGLTRFPLLGKHVKVECKKCHTTVAFKDVSLDCVGCHEKEDQHKRRLGTRCEACHNARDWKIWDFDHDTRTRFKLNGGHAGLDCYTCHKNPMGKTVKTPDSCVGCHKKDDKHEGSYGPQCERCHEASSWKPIRQGTGGLRFR